MNFVDNLLEIMYNPRVTRGVPIPMTPAEHNRNLNLIETRIDKYGLAYVVDLLAEICSDKADHLEANWQDATVAKALDATT